MSDTVRKRKTGEDVGIRERLYVTATPVENERFTSAWVRAAQRMPPGEILSFSAWVRRALHRACDAEAASDDMCVPA